MISLAFGTQDESTAKQFPLPVPANLCVSLSATEGSDAMTAVGFEQVPANFVERLVVFRYLSGSLLREPLLLVHLIVERGHATLASPFDPPI